MIELIKTLSFANYYAFLALLILPAIFFVLRSYPPKPNLYNFSSFYLIKNIDSTSLNKQKCPLWLLLFRLLLIIFLIIYFSKPYSYTYKPKSDFENYVILADKGWSMGSNWENYKEIIKSISLEAEKINKKILFYHPMMKEDQEPFIFSNTSDLLLYLKKISPSPWQTNRDYLKKQIKKNDFFKQSKVFFIFSKFDSLSFNKQVQFLDFLKDNVPHLDIISPVKDIRIIKQVSASGEENKFMLERFGNLNKEKVEIKIFSNEGSLLYKNEFIFKKGDKTLSITKLFPLEISNQFSKIEISDANHAASIYYMDDLNLKKNIGILSEDNNHIEQPLLSPVYYVQKALKSFHNVFLSDLKELLERRPSVIIFPDSKKLDNDNKRLILDWLSGGGLLIKFAGNKSIYNEDIFLNLNNYEPSIRYFGGDLSWQDNISLKKLDDDTIFKNIIIPKDIYLKKQLVLSNINEKKINILSTLEDGTPLITMRQVGNGKILLFHFTANNDWSNIPISKIFVEFLTKAVLLSKFEISSSLKPLQLSFRINGFGNLEEAKNIRIFENVSVIKSSIPSKNAIPGLYDNKDLAIALNLSGNIKSENFEKKVYEDYNVRDAYKNNINDYSNFFLVMIMVMALIDILFSSSLKKNLFFLNFIKKRLSILSLTMFLFFSLQDNSHANQYVNNTFLAYIKNNDENINKVSRSGLVSLKKALIRRTSIFPKGVVEIDINEDSIFYFPYLYWPINNKLINITEKGKRKVKNYLKTGGIILFDILKYSRDESALESIPFLSIKNFLLSLGIEDLNYIQNEHTLSKSFYLLNSFSGRWDNKILLIDNKDLELKDGVNSVIIGFNDWAGAWATDDNDYSLFPVVPGGEKQRETAFRFGINITMYALTGNYKSDQVHSKSILNRIKK